ncbi:chemotaxis protein CheA [Gracilimonas sp. Q87]|uniref:chemotaxis protein CheA n=1 Tax=Gracilimonas sp. Q87 TaxID=3384766 RepID=UPI0039842EE7
MFDKNQKLVQELEDIIRLMADLWPTDRENLPEAGAKFEKVIKEFDQNFGQLQKLINLSWDGLKHLYEKDEYFMMVKSATMQAVNTIREYILQNGDIKVEEFEKAYEDLEKSLKGGSESADTVINDEELGKVSQDKNPENGKPAEKSVGEPEHEKLLSELAAFIMTLSEDSATGKNKNDLKKVLQHVRGQVSEAVCVPLNDAISILEKAIDDSDVSGWLGEISEKTETAIEIQSNIEWDNSPESNEQDLDSVDKKDKTNDIKNEKDFIIPEDIEMAMVGEFVTECSDLLQMAEGALLDLEESPGDEELINTIFRSFHTIKGTSAFMGLDPISEFTHWVETFLSMVREGELEFDQACADISLESIDIINKMLAVVEHAKGGDPLSKPLRFDGMMQALLEVTEESTSPEEAFHKAQEAFDELTEPDLIDQEVNENANGIASKSESTGSGDLNGTADKNSKKPETESSVRVSVNRLDRLIDMVGELVIAHSVVAQDKTIPKDSELQKKVNHATKILRELQDTSLSLRMVPMKATFHKMNRLVRDLSRKAGKQVKFTIQGEDTEIDRNMVDVINEPLIHMIRNALDHGIETSDERSKTGKDETAHIQLSASQEGGKVVIKIEDDGRGIDKDKILNKAVEKGLIDPENKLSEEEIYNLIFLPGFSSAEKVTDLSGRGVGMDVVRRSIEQLQGKIDVASELGSGTTITIELPFTLAITDGMVVRIGNQRFIIPTLNIDMTFRAEDNDVFTVMGNSEQVSFRGKSVPVVRLHRLFSINGAVESLLEGTLIVIKNNKKRYALLVDEVVGQQQLVGKSINMMAKMDHISGGAIMGDGRVGLILDTVALMD